MTQIQQEISWKPNPGTPGDRIYLAIAGDRVDLRLYMDILNIGYVESD
jgi:hypothetical protein